jgi:hypothetical protein
VRVVVRHHAALAGLAAADDCRVLGTDDDEGVSLVVAAGTSKA